MGADLRLCNYIKRELFLSYCENICFLHADGKGLEFELSSHKQHLYWWIMEDRHPFLSPC